MESRSSTDFRRDVVTGTHRAIGAAGGLTEIDLTHFAEAINERGWAATAPVIDGAMVASLREVVAALAIDGRGGARHLLSDNGIRSLAASALLQQLARAVLGRGCFAVRALLFDKTPDANWKVIWHQDLTIATRERVDLPGYGPWSEKAGIPHVQPPVAILEHMLAIRVHLDHCGSENGPVRVIDGTHGLGRLSATAIDELRERGREHECVVAEGGILAFRPLLLHASAPATQPGHRRVIHIEYASRALDEPLEWHERVA